MAALHLPEHIHFCEIAGQRVFLDLLADRYFSLPPAADRIMSALLSREPAFASEDAAPLVVAGLLVEAPAGRPAEPTIYPAPESSLLEEASSERLHLGSLPEVWLRVAGARRAVSRMQLPGLLAAARTRSAAGPEARERRDRAARRFLRARRLVPVAPNCLYDSLALHRFLQSRSIDADLVIGAKLHPFGAHCWVQCGTTVLNDTLGSARGFAPILVA